MGDFFYIIHHFRLFRKTKTKIECFFVSFLKEEIYGAKGGRRIVKK